jgi:thymidylate kinase
MRIVLEGTDLIGKSTCVELLQSMGYEVQDREEKICKWVMFDIPEETAVKEISEEVEKGNYMLFVFYTTNKDMLSQRFKERAEKEPQKISTFDDMAWEYNQLYIKLFSQIPSAYLLCVDGKSKEDIAKEIISFVMPDSK